MADKYQMLENLERLRQAGTITEEEFQRERTKILNSDNWQANSTSELFGMSENLYLMLMHLSQFAGFLTVGLGFLAPFVLWILNKDKNKNVDRQGKNIFNFMLSWLIYYVVAGVLILTVILSLVGVPLLIVLGILNLIFIIIASVNAYNGVYWQYPLSIQFFNTTKFVEYNEIKK